jgi:hypothetical protein
MRKMIEEMMGHEALDGTTHEAIPFDNPKVCRSFLEGMCVHELFVNTVCFRRSSKCASQLVVAFGSI